MKQVYTVLPVCDFLIGLAYDDVARSTLTSLRPNGIRVAGPESCIADNAVPWRVTVFTDAANNILHIEQEVTIEVLGDLPVKNGFEFKQALIQKCPNIRQ